MPVWSPDPTAISGWIIEVPARSPTLPINLWIHWAGLSFDWAGFPPVQTDGHWHDTTGILTVEVAAGDRVVAGQGSISIASARREETTVFNTDNWGMALNNVGTLPGPVDGPGAVNFPVQMSTLGNCWPVGVAFSVDLLVLRTSLIPEPALPYGQRPKPNPLTIPFSDHATLVNDIALVKKAIGKLEGFVTKLEQTVAALPGTPVDVNAPPARPRPATGGISLSVEPLRRRRPPE